MSNSRDISSRFRKRTQSKVGNSIKFFKELNFFFGSKLNKNAWIQFLDSFLVEQSQKTPKKKKAWLHASHAFYKIEKCCVKLCREFILKHTTTKEKRRGAILVFFEILLDGRRDIYSSLGRVEPAPPWYMYCMRSRFVALCPTKYSPGHQQLKHENSFENWGQNRSSVLIECCLQLFVNSPQDARFMQVCPFLNRSENIKNQWPFYNYDFQGRQKKVYTTYYVLFDFVFNVARLIDNPPGGRDFFPLVRWSLLRTQKSRR